MPAFQEHDCLLLTPEDDIVTNFIDTGLCISLRRKFRSLCLVDRAHPLTSVHFKSHAACRNEKIRHLLYYYYMIHPFSTLNLYWEFFMFFLILCQLVLNPIDASYSIQHLKLNPEVFLVKFIVDVIQLFDIAKLFFTGYYDCKRSRVVLDPCRIAKHYLKTYFLIDTVSCTHSCMYLIKDMINISARRHGYIRLSSRLKIFRLPRLLNILELFRQFGGYSSYLFKGINVVLIFVMVTIWSFSITFYVQNYSLNNILKIVTDFSDVRLIATTLAQKYHAATVMLLVVSVEGKHISTIMQFISATFFLCFGFVLQMFLYAQILQVWTKYARAEHKHHSLHQQIKEYMKYKELPMSLRHRIFSYFEFKFHKHFFKESDINNMVSPILRKEILLHVARNHIEKVDFFKYLPENILMKVIGHLKSEIYLPGDVIISAGSSGYCMFFIYHGTVAVYTPMGKEICHLEDGAHFGEIALIFNELRVATVVAVTPCELFILRRSDFLEIIEPFPEFKKELLALAKERMQKIMLQSE